ncbi:heavy metal translocating P-type ATPase [Oceanobacter sp. 4_MG-2023]|uniref:heavy metal translocating P-type ATPase n=1 Tax=Oceanobacter sp. 4_MG-2023 TaxID=3062623 RepID=UPI0027332620|nr:heavy metal translocating P-type ATPase [Oceanobacter sp. 4_MG-2023]MDP2547286.1 heavy metal translocating P-type ATPase [Oceanobacter sp. 4_MG-2023]
MTEHANNTRCFHCGENVSPSDEKRWSALIDGQSQPMCCPGCKAIAETIVASGLKDYYKHRTALPELSPAELDDHELQARESLALYDSEAMQQRFVARLDNGMAEATLVIDGISCAACAWLIEHRLNALPGVDQAVLNLSNHRLVVRWEPEKIPVSSLIEQIYRLGYRASPFSATAAEQQRHVEGKRSIRRLAVAGIGMMQVMMLAVPLYVGMVPQYEFFMRLASMLLTLPVVLYAAWPFFEASIRDLKTRHLTMDVPVSLAIALAFCASIWSTFNQGKEVYFDSVCMFTFFLLLGRFLEMRARHRMGKSGNNLLTLLPNVALKLSDDTPNATETVIASEEVRLGDLLLIKPGHAIPADGVVIQGRSSVDEAALTGEYLPVTKRNQDHLIGGTINIESPIIMQVTATGAEAQLSTIVRLMDRAQQEKPRIALIADRIASRFVAAVLLISSAVFLFWWQQGNDHAFFIALSVLVVTCPCALSLATPTALTAATGALREAGLLISKGHVLESLPTIDRVVFDKTGTLTQGKLTIEDVVLAGELDSDQVLAITAGLEKSSSHPIARAFRRIRPDTVTEVQQHTGAGIQGQWQPTAEQSYAVRFGRPDFALPDHSSLDTSQLNHQEGQWLLLSVDDQAAAWIRLGDSVRKSATSLTQGLRQRKIKTALLTGDPGASGQQLATQLGIDDVQIGLSPEQKLQQVRLWQQQGERVLMIGDGINDVPVLAGADIAIAVSDATDLAKTSADALVTSGRLDCVLQALDTASRTRQVIYQNIAWALLYNLLALPVAAAGYIPPWAAAIGMSFSSLLVVSNALRLSRTTKPDVSGHN